MSTNSRAMIFPLEIWIRIIDECYLPQLLRIALTCSQMKRLCTSATIKEREVMKDYFHFEMEMDKFNVYDLFLDILSEKFPASYVLKLDCGELCVNEEDIDEDWEHSEWQPLYKTRGFSDEEHKLISQAVQRSQWIEECDCAEFETQIRDGNEDAVLCILVPLLTGLRSLVLPANLIRLPKTIAKIAGASRLVANPTDSSSEPVKFGEMDILALKRLLLVSNRAYNETELGMALEVVAPFTALPSVRRIVVCHGRDDRFIGWPDGLPRSQVRDVLFYQSSVTESAIREFAKGFVGPCVMRQHWVDYFLTPNLRLEWDHCEVGGDLDDATGLVKEGTRFEKTEIRYQPRIHINGCSRSNRPISGVSEGMNELMFDDLADWSAFVDTHNTIGR